MLQYYLRMEPQLFHAAVDQQLQRLKEEKEAKEEAVRKSQEEETSTPQRSKSDLVLYQRMEEVSCTFGWLAGCMYGRRQGQQCAAGFADSNMRMWSGVSRPPAALGAARLQSSRVRKGLVRTVSQINCC